MTTTMLHACSDPILACTLATAVISSTERGMVTCTKWLIIENCAITLNPYALQAGRLRLHDMPAGADFGANQDCIQHD